MLKKIVFIFFIIFIFLPCASAENNINETYKEQFKISGADNLIDSLPRDTSKSLENMGITGKDFNEVTKINPAKFFDEVISQVKDKSKLPLKTIAPVIGIILLCAMIESVDLSLGNTNMSEIMSAIGCLCICTCIINPIVAFIVSVSIVIKGVSGFIMCFIPVMAGIMIASGQTVTASSYQIMMTGAGQIISQLCTSILVPLMNTMLGIAVISSISQRLKLGGICELIYKIIKWCLGISTSIFTALLALQNLVAAPADNVGGKTAKLALSSFVPIVGSALGDAFNTVHSCVKLLKSGVGAFGILAGGLMFLPAIVECCIWMSLLALCSAVGDILIPGKISTLLRSTSKVIQAMLAIILSCITVLIVSTVIILLIGNGA